MLIYARVIDREVSLQNKKGNRRDGVSSRFTLSVDLEVMTPTELSDAFVTSKIVLDELKSGRRIRATLLVFRL